MIAQSGINELRRVREAGESRRIAADDEADRTRVEGQAEADRIRAVEGANVEAERDRIAVYRDLSGEVLFGLAAQELAGNLHTIEHLNLSPDLFGPLLTNLVQAGTRRLEAEPEA